MEALALALDSSRREEVARRVATVVTRVAPSAQLYPDLPPLDCVAVPKPPAKQLHPGWVAARQQKPELRSLWDAEEQQQQVCSAKGIAVYQRPDPHQVATACLATH
ncbi:WD_REPEATS_REGION domain-containing protein [Haematococcus lacustris]|uniref:WD_REPEATS_REGION domain-containing protein n=1 Tax=Haematococcus lacustris TaxID=44745 RepID=A0A699YWN6_HAELA|nr:WD_REPEATS_REGION domain-containing protein [Haematococcus lacustris]